MSKIICTSCTVKTDKIVKALVIRDKETGKEVLPDGHHIDVTGGKLTLVQRVSKVHINPETHKKTITWDSQNNPKYEVKEEPRIVQEQQDKVFSGTKYQAEQAGWVENEFGWVCPECSGNLPEEGSSTELDPSAFLGNLK